MTIPASERVKPLGNRFRDLAMILRRIRLEERSGATRKARAWARLGMKQSRRQRLPNLESLVSEIYWRGNRP